MKRFIKNLVVFVLLIPALLIMFALFVWDTFIKSLMPIIGNFKPYKWLNKLDKLFYFLEQKTFG